VRRAVAAAVAALLTVTLITPATASAAPDEVAGDEAPASAPVTTEVAPVVVLLDTSGSMNEDDGSGLLKLRGAKSAIRNVVNELSRSTVFGVWTYPSDGCDTGSYISMPAPLNDPAAVMSKVESMVASGDTPTGTALRAVADDLTNRGYSGATIVLISDGESTCGPPPCDVAKELVADGFNVTVPSIGFRTSARGEEELRCVSEATGAQTFNAADGDQLSAYLAQLTKSTIDLTVRYDPSPISGSSTKITAVVTHVSGEPAKDVRIALTFAPADDPTARRAGIPPIIRVGNIPQGQSVERTWTIGTGGRGQEKETVFTVSAWGANALRVGFDGTYTPRAPRYTQDELGELFAGVSAEHPLVVFGDSYSSGEGVGAPYLQTPTGVSANCHRNSKTYLGSVFDANLMRIVACSGAVSEHLSWSSDRSDWSQVAEMNARVEAPGAGVLTFGGNDIGFVDVVKLCLDPRAEPMGCSNPEFVRRKLAEADALAGKLPAVYQRAWSAMNTADKVAKRGGKYAPLIVLPYPRVTHEPRAGICHQFNAHEVDVADRLARQLNGAIARAVARVRADGYEVYFVPDVEDAVRPDHTLCAWGDGAWINGWIFAVNDMWAEPESVHPKASGYQAETDAILRWTRTTERATPDVDPKAIEADLRGVLMYSDGFGWPQRVNVDIPTTDMLLTVGSRVNVNGSGYMPGTPVTGALHSDPIVLGTIVADENGNIDGTLIVPADAPVGQHHLVMSGIGEDGGYLERRIAVVVVQPTPLWVWAAASGAVLALLAGVALAVVGIIKRNRAARRAVQTAAA